MTQTFWIEGLLPGMNDIIAIAKKHPKEYSKFKRETGKIVDVYILKARLIPMTHAHVTFDWLEPNARRDPDGIRAGAKFILDALVARGILPNDNVRCIVGLADTFKMNCERAGVWVTLENSL